MTGSSPLLPPGQQPGLSSAGCEPASPTPLAGATTAGTVTGKVSTRMRHELRCECGHEPVMHTHSNNPIDSSCSMCECRQWRAAVRDWSWSWRLLG